MNRADIARDLLVLEQVAKKAYARAATLREVLEADARAEYAEQGTAPSWGIPELGRLILPITKDSVVVDDEPALIAWLETNVPHAVVQRIDLAVLKSLLATVVHDDGAFCLPDGSGGLVPGLAIRPGGQPKTLTFTPTREATAVVGRAADAILGKVAAELGVAVSTEPVAVPDAA